MTEAVEARIEKLLRLADGGANENESASALAMAQKLADAYNLDLGVIGKSGSRKDETISKGLYPYQRTLYGSVAALNHCKAWISKGTHKGSKYTTRLLGSKVNVAMTIRLCDYVEEVANRLVRENMSHVNYFSREAHIYREGVIDRLVQRIRDRRAEEEKERQREKREQQARQSHPGAAMENAIILISDVAREEEKANYDYQYGEGAWDRAQERIRLYREEQERVRAEQEKWELENPEEVARIEAERKARIEAEIKRQKKLDEARERRRQERINQYGYDPKDYRRKPTKYDSGAYWKGQSDGEGVGIDDQISHQSRQGIK